MPIWATAIGRAWLAGVDAATRETAIELLQSQHSAAWRLHGPVVRAELASFSRRGFCLGLGQWQQDVHAVAVPMSLCIANETLVFNCGVPAALLTPTTMEHELGPGLVEMVREVEQAYLKALAA